MPLLQGGFKESSIKGLLGACQHGVIFYFFKAFASAIGIAKCGEFFPSFSKHI